MILRKYIILKEGNGMNEDKRLISAADMMLRAANIQTGNGDEITSVWKNVVSKIHSYRDESENNTKRISIGERLAGNTRVVDLKNGILFIETDHSGWIQYLKMYQKFILNGIKMTLPEIKVNSLAFRIAGSQAKVSDIYDSEVEKQRNALEKEIERQENQLKKFNKTADEKNNGKTSTLPPEILAKFESINESIKESMLTNLKNK